MLANKYITLTRSVYLSGFFFNFLYVESSRDSPSILETISYVKLLKKRYPEKNYLKELKLVIETSLWWFPSCEGSMLFLSAFRLVELSLLRVVHVCNGRGDYYLSASPPREVNSMGFLTLQETLSVQNYLLEEETNLSDARPSSNMSPVLRYQRPQYFSAIKDFTPNQGSKMDLLYFFQLSNIKVMSFLTGFCISRIFLGKWMRFRSFQGLILFQYIKVIFPSSIIFFWCLE